MPVHPYELLARYKADGTVAGAYIKRLEIDANGRARESDPEPLLLGAADPAFATFALQFNAQAVADRDALQRDLAALDALYKALQADDLALKALHSETLAQHAELTTMFQALSADHAQLGSDLALLTGQLDTALVKVTQLQAELVTANGKVEQLQAELAAIANPPGPDLTTVDGVRAFVSDQRFTVETSGITIGVQVVSTQRDEIGHWVARFDNAMKWLQGDVYIRKGNPAGVYPYKPKNGKPTILSAAQVVRAYECMAWYINTCFGTEEHFSRLIDQGTPLPQILAALPGSWPQRQFQWEAPQ